MNHRDAWSIVNRHAGQLAQLDKLVLVDALQRIPYTAQSFEVECGLTGPTFSNDTPSEN